MPDSYSRLKSALHDRYSLKSELGAGGMATVYLAEDRKHGRDVAIKVLRRELAASLDAERFLREIGIAARLSHPHIVPLLDSGSAGGFLYFVSPYVTGGSLRDLLRKSGGGRLPVKDALRIAKEVGAGLDFAHRNGYVHRDVKPENILFADGHAILADFGVARACCGPGGAVPSGAAPASTITEVGIAVGTPEYMSPEQAAGQSDLGTPSDVYALGCVVYEMLAGSPPVTGAGPRETMAKQVTERPRPLRVLRPDAPASVERALERALEKDPEARFPSVAALLEALEAVEPETVGRRIGARRSVAVLPFVNAGPRSEPGNEYLSDGITDELIVALARVEGLRVASRTSVFALKGKPQDVRAIGALLGVSEVLEGTVRTSGGRLRVTAQLSSTADGRLLWSERYDRTFDDVFAIQDEIARTIVNTLRATSFADLSEPAPRRGTESVAAYGLYLRGRFEYNKRTQEGVAEGIRYLERAVAEDPRYALAYTGLADAYSLHVDYRSVPVYEGFARAKEYARKAIELDPTLPDPHASLAWCLFIHDWDWEGAEREYRRAVELDPRCTVAHQWHAFLLAARLKLDEAVVEVLTALDLDPASIGVRRSLAWLYYYARRYDRARDHAARAMELNPTAEESHRILGLTLAQQGLLDEAVRVFREARDLPGAGPYAMGTLGYALARVGKRDEARAILAELEKRARTEYVTPVAFGTLLIGLGDNAGALDWLEKAYAERRGWLCYIAVNPLMDPLRNEPRFKDLLNRMHL